MLYDSLQTAAVSARLGEVYRDAGGTGPAVAIRRVWIGDPPSDEMAAQMAHYRSYAPEAAMKNWDGDQLITAPTAEQAAAELVAFLVAAGCDTVNVRIHVKGLSAAQVDDQLARHAEGFVGLVREGLAAHATGH
ncbi:MAG: hypothetical protein R2695_13300 [Acidimicrobiales bacterium]